MINEWLTSGRNKKMWFKILIGAMVTVSADFLLDLFKWLNLV
jgi:hypothetical protein